MDLGNFNSSHLKVTILRQIILKIFGFRSSYDAIALAFETDLFKNASFFVPSQLAPTMAIKCQSAIKS